MQRLTQRRRRPARKSLPELDLIGTMLSPPSRATMRRRDKIVKVQRRTTLRRRVPKGVHNSRSSAESEDKKIAQLTRERDEALEQQTASSEVLKIISRSTFDLQAVLNTLVKSAAHLCEAEMASMNRKFGETYQQVSSHGFSPEFEKYMLEHAVDLERGTAVARAIKEKKPVQISDVLDDPNFKLRDVAQLGGVRSVAAVPILKEDDLIGVIAVYRHRVRPFTARQIDLLQTFAAQAVIAIENTRLLSELRQRTDDLTESLERQTATLEILKAISNSQGNLQPVFDVMLDNALSICDAKFGMLMLYRPGDGSFLTQVMVGAPSTLVEALLLKPFVPPLGNPLDRMRNTKKTVNVIDAAAEKTKPLSAKLAGAHSHISVPMLKGDELIGAISIYRTEVYPFTNKQIELVQNFAAQAVIAIENARLLNDLNKLNQQLEQLVADQVSEIERMGRLRRFLPPQVADLIVASGAEKQLESHRREITALFCDLRGFTGFSESSEPEDVMALLRDYHAAIGQIIIKYSGTLERYAGDGVMVVFNDPVPVENPTLQAVLMALEMRNAIGALTESWRRWGHDIGFGIGIAHGFATLGTIGFEGRFDYAAIGTVSNVASRLCDEAEPGQILISPRVLTKVENAVAVEPVGEFVLKGIRRPLAAYNVLSDRTVN